MSQVVEATGTGTIIDKITQEGLQKEKEKWKEIFTRILDVIRFLAKQNLALRGHQETNQPGMTQNMTLYFGNICSELILAQIEQLTCRRKLKISFIRRICQKLHYTACERCEIFLHNIWQHSWCFSRRQTRANFPSTAIRRPGEQSRDCRLVFYWIYRH